LREFNPYLTGGALDGTAGRYSAAEIELFADSSKDVEIALLSHGISYEVMDKRKPWLDSQLAIDWRRHPPSCCRSIRRSPNASSRKRITAAMADDGLAPMW
jgi:hypothetical protein